MYHPKYLEYYKNASKIPGGFVHYIINPLKKNFEDLRSTFTLPRDRQQIDYYEKLVYFLIHHFYSPEAEYVAKRASFALHTEEGFRKYGHYILKESEKLKIPVVLLKG